MTKPEVVPLTNRHPADQLAEVREEIGKLEERAGKLRAKLLEMPEDQRRGDQCFADVRTKTHELVDLKKLRTEFGLERLEPFMRYSTSQYVFLIPTKKKR